MAFEAGLAEVINVKRKIITATLSIISPKKALMSPRLGPGVAGWSSVGFLDVSGSTRILSDFARVWEGGQENCKVVRSPGFGRSSMHIFRRP